VHAEVAVDLARHRSDLTLSVREVAVLELVAEGNSNKAIGQLLHINEETVKGHLKNGNRCDLRESSRCSRHKTGAYGSAPAMISSAGRRGGSPTTQKPKASSSDSS
jgi:DNA-binding CsgD family transcriptional regulator